jgi:hypothetical protein
VFLRSSSSSSSASSSVSLSITAISAYAGELVAVGQKSVTAASLSFVVMQRLPWWMFGRRRNDTPPCGGGLDGLELFIKCSSIDAVSAAAAGGV